MKSFSFGDPGFTMDIPKILAVRNVAVELIYTSYDHRSPLAKSFYPKIKKKATPEVVVNETDAKEEGNPEVQRLPAEHELLTLLPCLDPLDPKML